jgi:cell division protein FtsL
MKAIKLILFSAVLSLVFSLKYESTSINLNQKITGQSNQKNIQFYNLKIEQNSQNQDLFIDSKTLNSKTIYESPIVMISPVNKIKIFFN